MCVHLEQAHVRACVCVAEHKCVCVQEQLKQRLDRELESKAEAIASAQIEEEGVRFCPRCIHESSDAERSVRLKDCAFQALQRCRANKVRWASGR